MDKKKYRLPYKPTLFGVGLTTNEEESKILPAIHVSDLFTYDEAYSFDPANGFFIGLKLMASSIEAGVCNLPMIRKRVLTKALEKFS